jgi:hypothetical protein
MAKTKKKKKELENEANKSSRSPVTAKSAVEKRGVKQIEPGDNKNHE